MTNAGVQTPAAEASECYYQGAAYSLGAVLYMGRIERTCIRVERIPTWVRG